MVICLSKPALLPRDIFQQSKCALQGSVTTDQHRQAPEMKENMAKWCWRASPSPWSSPHWAMLSKIQVTEGEVTNDGQNQTPVGLPHSTLRRKKTTLEAAWVVDIHMRMAMDFFTCMFSISDASAGWKRDQIYELDIRYPPAEGQNYTFNSREYRKGAN